MRITFLIIGLFFLALCPGYAFDDGDFQVWHTEAQEKKINDKSKITLEEEFRFGDDASDFYYYHYDIGYVYSAGKHLDLGLNYRQVYDKKAGKFKVENRPHLNATAKYELWGFKLEDRNRLEYRHFDYQEDSWRYRNKFSLKAPWKFSFLQVQPYLADEMFLNLNGIDFDRNRFYAGFLFNIVKPIRGELYYLLQSSKSSGEWKAINALGTKIKFAF